VIPPTPIEPITALGYSEITAIQTSQGKDFKNWFISQWVRGILKQESLQIVTFMIGL